MANEEPLHEQQLKVEQFLRKVYLTRMREMHQDLYAGTWDDLSKKEKKPFTDNEFYDFSLNLLENAECIGNKKAFREHLNADDPWNPFTDEQIEELLNILYYETKDEDGNISSVYKPHVD